MHSANLLYFAKAFLNLSWLGGCPVHQGHHVLTLRRCCLCRPKGQGMQHCASCVVVFWNQDLPDGKQQALPTCSYGKKQTLNHLVICILTVLSCICILYCPNRKVSTNYLRAVGCLLMQRKQEKSWISEQRKFSSVVNEYSCQVLSLQADKCDTLKNVYKLAAFPSMSDLRC